MLSWSVGVFLYAAAGWRHHVKRHVPLRYDATLWSIVFPLSMYALAGIYLGQADHLPIVGAVGRGGLWVAFAVWLVVLVGMVRHVWPTVVAPRAQRPV